MVKFILYIIFISFGLFSKANSEKINLDDVKFIDINGEVLKLSEVDSEIILVVNTASFCGFTKQYAHLQSLRDKYDNKQLFILAIPSNDFGNQEPGSNKEIKDFCEGTYGITFPIMSKQKILGRGKHDFYKLIEENYGSKYLPKWNFHKYLIKKDGTLISSFSSHISPLAPKFIDKINSNL